MVNIVLLDHSCINYAMDEIAINKGKWDDQGRDIGN